MKTANLRNIDHRQVETACSWNTIEGHSLEVTGSPWPPLPGKAIKATLSCFTENSCLHVSIQHLWTEAEFQQYLTSFKVKKRSCKESDVTKELNNHWISFTYVTVEPSPPSRQWNTSYPSALNVSSWPYVIPSLSPALSNLTPLPPFHLSKQIAHLLLSSKISLHYLKIF